MNSKKVCLLVGSMAISGGTYVIIQHAFYLQDHGFDVTLAVQEPFSTNTLAWHDKALGLRCLPIKMAKDESFDIVIATWWKTALELHHFNAPRFGYFVQSIESRFYPLFEAPLRKLADSTYQLPVAYVTEATWIRDYLKNNYGHNVALVHNGIRKDLYHNHGKVLKQRNQDRQPRVLVEGHFGVPFKNTALAVRLAREAGAKDVWLLTGTPVKWVPGVSRIFSRVPMNLTPEIYRSCDILVKLSTVEGMFGPPLEIFHCGGTAIVFDVTGHDEYIVDGQNACVVRRGDMDGVVTALRRLLTDRAELDRLQAGALQTANAWLSWDKSSSAFRNWVDAALDGPTVDRASLAGICEQALSEYVRDEQQRLVNMPRLSRHRLGEIASRFPLGLRRMLKQFEAAVEVLFGARVVR